MSASGKSEKSGSNGSPRTARSRSRRGRSEPPAESAILLPSCRDRPGAPALLAHHPRSLSPLACLRSASAPAFAWRGPVHARWRRRRAQNVQRRQPQPTRPARRARGCVRSSASPHFAPSCRSRDPARLIVWCWNTDTSTTYCSRARAAQARPATSSRPSPASSSRQSSSSKVRLSSCEFVCQHLLTPSPLTGLAKWSRGETSEATISEIYVKLGNDFNVACAAFAREGISMKCAASLNLV